MVVDELGHRLAQILHRVVERAVLRIGIDTRHGDGLRSDHRAVDDIVHLQRQRHLGLVIHLAVDVRLEGRKRNVVGLTDNDLLGAQRLVGGFALGFPVGVVHHVLGIAVGVEFRQRFVGQGVDDVETPPVGKARQHGGAHVVARSLTHGVGAGKGIDDHGLLRGVLLRRSAQRYKHGSSRQKSSEYVFHRYV